MPKPFDAVAKDLIDRRPADWLALLGQSASDVEPLDVEFLDSDLSLVTSQADRVLRVNAPEARLRYEPSFADELLKGVRGMRESATYRAILEEGRDEGLLKGLQKGLEEGREEGRDKGRAEGERRMLLLAAETHLGRPTRRVTARLSTIDSVEVLERLMARLFTVKSWDELLASA